MSDDLADRVKADIEARIDRGVATYGERLKTFNGRDALNDAYEEALDLALYLSQELAEKDADRTRSLALLVCDALRNTPEALPVTVVTFLHHRRTHHAPLDWQPIYDAMELIGKGPVSAEQEEQIAHRLANARWQTGR